MSEPKDENWFVDLCNQQQDRIAKLEAALREIVCLAPGYYGDEAPPMWTVVVPSGQHQVNSKQARLVDAALTEKDGAEG